MNTNPSTPDSAAGPEEALPRLSVLMPVHDEEKLLDATLTELRLQDYPADRWETILGLNACSDRSAEIARAHDVVMVESPAAGISHGRNIAAAQATGEIFVFLDADTTIPRDGLRRIATTLQQAGEAILVTPGRPYRAGPFVRVCFAIANYYARKKQVLSPGPVMATQRSVFERIQGFDEALPQGNATDFVVRCREQGGARYIFASDLPATTSTRRFQRFGMIQQLWSWRKNHQLLAEGKRDAVSKRTYPVVR